MQDGRAIFNCAISFHEETKGLDHQNPEKEGFAFPEALSNPGLEDDAWRTHQDGAAVRTLFSSELVEIRRAPLDEEASDSVMGSEGFWFRFPAQSYDDSLVHQLLLTFISDYGLVFTQRKRGIGASRRVYSSDTDYINETVTAWQEGRGFTLALHTDDGSAPAPFREAAFTYELRAVGEARTLLQTRLLITMRGGAVGEWLARKVMAGTFESRLDAVSGGLKRLYESDHTSAMPGF